MYIHIHSFSSCKRAVSHLARGPMLWKRRRGYSEWGYSESVRIGKFRRNLFLQKTTISQAARKYVASQLASQLR